MADIFISYARDDRAKAKALAEALEGEDFSVWWDPNITPGETWDEVIERELAAAKCVVVLWSSTSIRKRWVKVEATEALDRRILVPALIENVLPPLAFRPIEAADLTDWRGQPTHQEYNQLRAAIRGLIGPSTREMEAEAKQYAQQEEQLKRAEAEASQTAEEEAARRRIEVEAKRTAETVQRPQQTPSPPIKLTWMAMAVVGVLGVGGIITAANISVSPPKPNRETLPEPAADATPPGSGFEVGEMDATYIVTTTSNVRVEPTAQSDRLGRLSKDSGVNVTGQVKGKNWYRIAFEGGTAYVHAAPLKPIDAAELATWQRIAESNDASDFERFLRSHPNGHFAERAQQRLLDFAPVVDEETASSTDRATTSAARRYPLGETFKDCEVCPEMVVIPAGSFMMGSPPSEEGRYDDEGPQHRAMIAKTFAVGKHEVTFAEWDACVDAGGCDGYRPDDAGWGRSRRPVINVSWRDAQAYVAWLREKTGKAYRLLSEAEWEYVARAGTTTPFSFGETISTNQANYYGKYTYGSGVKGLDRDQTVEVGGFPANAWGLHDMHGNVWEWVEDVYHDNYNGAPIDGSAWTDGVGISSPSSRVVRGGGWKIYPRNLRSAVRDGLPPGYRYFYVGFRVARTID